MAVADSAPAGSAVAHESRVRMRQAIIAGGAGICLLAAAAVQTTSQPKVGELTVELLNISQHSAQEIIGGVLNALGFVGLALTVAFLFQASRARRPASSPATRLAALIGGLLAAVGGVAYAIVLTIKAHDFAGQGAQTYLEGKNLVGTTGIAALQYAGLVGTLLLAIGFVLVAMNAMRVGLLTKFLGYLGMAAAAGSLFLAGSPFGLIIEVFWLLAVAYLLAGRWPNGDPRAWVTGQAEPWPTAAEVREQRQQASGRSSGGGRSASPAKPAPRRPQPSAGNQATRSTTPKRKRKRRK